VSEDQPNDVPNDVEDNDAEETTAAPDALEVMREERDRLRDQLLRVAADFDNYRKRSRKEVDDAERRGKEEVIREVLPVLDNLERALGAVAAMPDNAGPAEVRGIAEGVKMVMKLFDDQATRMGLTRIKSVGERFDPGIHDAIQQVETDEHAAGTVIHEVAAGYRLGEKLVRPAMVIVARKPAATA